MIRRLSGRSDSVRGWEIPALLSVIVLTIAWTAWLQLRPGVLPGAAHADPVDAAALRADLETIVGDGTPRVVGTPGSAAGRDRIEGILASLGLAVERQRTRIERRAGAVDVENLVATIDGTGSDDMPAIAVVAHSDSVPGSPGASDDGAGVASLCAVARALVARPPVHDVLLLVTDGEERGLLGSQAFMAQHPAAGSLRAVVNLDARGASGPAAIFELGPESAWLSGVIADAVPAPRTQSLAAAIYERMPNGTDFSVFLAAGVSGFNVAFIGDVAAYHRPEDTVERQSPWTRAHMASTALALVRGLDATWPADGVIPPGRAVFGDVLGTWVLRWPEAWTSWIVGVAALVLGAGSLRARINAHAQVELLALARHVGRHGRTDATRPEPEDVPSLASGVSRSLAACLVVVVASSALGWLASAAASASGIDLARTPGRAVAIALLVWLAAAVLALGTGAWLGRRAAPWDAVLGAWAVWLAPAAAAAWVLPSASMLLVVPLVAAASTCLVARLWPGWGAGAVAFAGAAAAALTWIPLEPLMFDALGLSLGAFGGLRAGMLGILAVPLVATASCARPA
jgi:hypothetical protein